MARFDPATDPRVRDAINWERSQRGLPPLGTPAAPVAAPAAAPVNTFQALTPEEQALGAMQAEQQALVDAQVEANPYHSGGGASPAPAVVSTAPGLDWMPPEQAAMQPATEEEALAAMVRPQPEAAPMRQPGQVRVGGGIPNPIPGMLADTTQRRQEAESAAKASEEAGNEAVNDAKQAAKEIGKARAESYGNVADIQQRTASEGQAFVDQLTELEDSRNKAIERVRSEERQISDFISNYEPKDRRTIGQRVMSALAVGLASLFDGIGGTNNGDQVASMISRGIDRDLEMQREMLNNKRTALAAKNTELGQVREKFGDSVDNLKLARAMKLDQAAQEIEAAKARGLQGEALAVADQTIAQLRLERENLLMGINQEKAQRYLAQEQQLKMTRYQQSLPRVQSEKERLDLESKRLANEKARRELEGGGPERKLNEGELKLKRDLEGLANGGVFERVYGYVARGDNPYVGVRGVGAMAPQIFTPSDNIRYKRDLLSLGMSVLRDKSGAAMPANEVEQELDRYGAFSGDPEVAREGVRQLLAEASSRAQAIGLKPKDIGLPSLDVRPE